MSFRVPDVFLVGGPKCGTTAVAKYLSSHPGIFHSTPKEPNYFNHDHAERFRWKYGAQIHHDSLERYAALFSAARAAQLCMESTVWYLSSGVAIERIQALQPAAKFIVMLREPISLLQSFHSQMLWVFIEDEPDLVKAWRKQERRALHKDIPPFCLEPAFLQYREVCRLGSQLARLRDLAGPDRVHIEFLDDLKADPGGVYSRVLDFLGLPHDGRSSFPKTNPQKAHRIRWLSRIVLWENRLPALRRVVRKLNVSKVARPTLPAEFREELRVSFRPQVEKIEDLTGRRLDHWLVG